jgi:hypothetical protein
MKNSRLPRKALPTKRRPNLAAKWVAVSLACVIGLAHGEVRLSTDWSSDMNHDGTRKPRDESDGPRFRDASDAASYSRDAVGSSNGVSDRLRLMSGFKLYVNETKYFLRPAAFMTKSRPDEACTPKSGITLAYQCKEGQRTTSDCHLIFFDAKFAEAGFNTVKVNEPYQFYCNSVVGVGVRAKGSDDLLVTVQYFPIDQKLASKASEIGTGWNRMTVLFHIKAVDGKIIAEQDDACLGNPNRIDNIPDARKRLAKCIAAGTLKR